MRTPPKFSSTAIEPPSVSEWSVVREMNKLEVISRIKAERAPWNELVAQLDDDRMLRTAPARSWTGKDIVAHVIWYEREMVTMLKSRALAGSNLWALPVHERNAAVHQEIRDLTLQEVRTWADRTYVELIEQLELLPEGAYADARYFQHMPGEWAPWKVIAGNTFEHYPEHLPAIRALMESG